MKDVILFWKYLTKEKSNNKHQIIRFDTEFKGFMKFEPFSFLVNDTTLPSDNSLRVGKTYDKRTFSEKIKTIVKKIEQNKVQYYLIDKLLWFWHYHQEMLVNI